MKKFVFLAHGEMDQSPETREAHQRWWSSMAGSVVDSGNPLIDVRDVGKDGVVSADVAEPARGYTIVQAESMDAAVALLDGCPMDMWVYEAMPM
jgi:hypothetical protein